MKIGRHEIEFRGLTRGELKQLKLEGIDPSRLPDEDEERDPHMDRIFGIAAPGLDPESLTPAEAMELVILIGRLTFLGEGELKKFAESQESGSPDGSTPAAGAGKKGSGSKGAARRSKRTGGRP